MAETWQKDAEKLLAPLGKVRSYSTRDFGRDQHPEALSVVIPGGGPMVKDSALKALKKVREELAKGSVPNGGTRCVAWLGTTRWLGEEKNDGKVELAIAEGKDQLDILRHAASDAINYGMETEDLVKKLAAYDKKYSIDIFHAETDTIEFDVKGDVDDWGAFAKDLYKFCPDIVDQGIGTVERLEEALVDTGRVYLWWD